MATGCGQRQADPCLLLAVPPPSQVRDKQESKRNCQEDLHNLGEHFNATRAAKEVAERELAKVRGAAGGVDYCAWLDARWAVESESTHGTV